MQYNVVAEAIVSEICFIINFTDFKIRKLLLPTNNLFPLPAEPLAKADFIS
jgi:hypothetical protein